MGFNTVAVIFNDHTHRLLEDDGRISRDIATAMRNWGMRDRDSMATWFGAGRVVSQASADYSQVVVCGHNGGAPISECGVLDFYALDQIADALRRHGWTAKPPAKQRTKKPAGASCP